MDEIILDVITNITGFMTYFAPGYIFISGFSYAACLERETEKEYLIIKSISISYLLYTVASYIGTKVNVEVLLIQVMTFIFAILLGLIFGRMHRTKWANQVSLFLFKREMTSNMFVELWERTCDKDVIVCVTLTMKDNFGIFEGQIYKVSSYNKNPEILLSYYICYDNNMKIISDYSNTETINLLVHYSDIQKFEFELISNDTIME